MHLAGITFYKIFPDSPPSILMLAASPKEKLWVDCSLELKTPIVCLLLHPRWRMENLPLDLQGSRIMNY